MSRKLDAKVAEVMGWQWVRTNDEYHEEHVRILVSPDYAGRYLYHEASGDEPLGDGWSYFLLHYSTAIAASREMEDWIEKDRSLRAAYIYALAKTANKDVKIDGRNLWLPAEGEAIIDLLWHLIHATPAQRCLAFLRAMGVEVEE